MLFASNFSMIHTHQGHLPYKMAQLHTTFSLTLDHVDALETVFTLLRHHSHKHDDYYAYERGEFWHMGLGSQATLLIDSQGQTAAICADGKREIRLVNGRSLADIAREFISQYSKPSGKIYGQAGFNYAAHIRGQVYNPGQWPLLSLMVPRSEVTIHRNYITVVGHDEYHIRELCYMLKATARVDTPRFLQDDMKQNTDDYKSTVARALLEIAEDQYTKVIVSRAVDLKDEIDMPATLLWGRRGNTPARTFSLSHEGFEATGFSPELVMSLENRKVVTEPLAGTRSRIGTDFEVEQRRRELLSDSKEIVEHIISVKEAVQELTGLCQRGSVIIEDLMSVRERGSVQHLGSRVSGNLSPRKDGWDAFDVLFPAITASGIPKASALSAIQRLEGQPRELYSGAILFLEGTEIFEATLVLRTVFQDQTRRWIQVGAGIIAQSNPDREMVETSEKLESIAPFLVAKDVNSML